MFEEVGIIIQARMGSKRLPGKSMFDLAGAPLVGRILERIKRCRAVNKIILAIPDKKEDDILNSLAKKYGVSVYRGSENNLLERYYKAALKYKIKTIVRFPADNPTPEPAEIDKIIKHHLTSNQFGFSSNICSFKGSGYPDGIGAEVFGFLLLEDLYFDKHKCISYEHIHKNFINYEKSEAIDEDWCPISTIICPKRFARPDLVLDVNYHNQYQYMKSLYETLYKRSKYFTIEDIIEWNDSLEK